MRTEATSNHPAIEWDDLKTELIESDSEERSKTFIAIGYDDFGNMYMGSAVFVCDELEKIEEIEMV